MSARRMDTSDEEGLHIQTCHIHDSFIQINLRRFVVQHLFHAAVATIQVSGVHPDDAGTASWIWSNGYEIVTPPLFVSFRFWFSYVFGNRGYHRSCGSDDNVQWCLDRWREKIFHFLGHSVSGTMGIQALLGYFMDYIRPSFVDGGLKRILAQKISVRWFIRDNHMRGRDHWEGSIVSIRDFGVWNRFQEAGHFS